MTNKPIITRTNIFLLIVILILIYLVTCNRKVTTTEPVKTIPEQIEAVRIDSVASAKYQDSVNKIVSYWQGQSTHWENNWNREVKDNAELQKTVGDILNESVPDTCEQYKQKAIAAYNKLSISSAKKDTDCSNAIGALKNVVTQKDVLVAKGKKDYSLLKLHFDTALSIQKILQSDIKKLKQKREIFIGVSSITSYLNIKPQIGAVFGYRTKNGTQITFGYYTNNYVSLSLSKPLFRF